MMSQRNSFSKLLRSSAILRKLQPNGSNRLVHLSAWQLKRVAFNLSDIGEGIREVIVKEWFVKEGDVVEQFDNLCEVQSDKASVTITSRYDGKILKLHHAIDETALVGKALIDFEVDDSLGAETQPKSEQQSIAESASSLSSDSSSDSSKISSSSSGGGDDDSEKTRTNRVLATPAVRRIAGENNVSLTDVKPSGRDGRVLKSDILEHLNLIPPTSDSNRAKQISQRSKPTVIAPPATSAAPDATAEDRIEKLKDVRKIMFKTMTQSLRIPHFTYSDEVNITRLIAVRNNLKGELEASGVKLTFMPFFIKAASLALTKYPILNSSVCEETESIVYKSAHNISVAIATDKGLVVPNIKNCLRKSIVDIARDLNGLQQRGQQGQLTPDDFANGTFSLSNIGVVGGTYTKPCIVPPQVAIGAIGTTQIVPRFDANDAITKAHLIHVSWSGDHRVIDGVTMAGFSNEWKQYIEQPERFILQ